MNTIEEQLSNIIEKSLIVAEQTGQFVLEQAPDIMQQFLAWQFWYHLFLMVIFLLLTIFVPYTLKQAMSSKSEGENDSYIKRKGRYWVKDRSSYSDSSEIYSIYIGFKLLSLLFLIGVVVNLSKVIYITVAPKVYLIEYFIK